MKTAIIKNILRHPEPIMDDFPFDEHWIPVNDKARIYARDYGGIGPVIFLLHGFPDNIHLYDYLVPELYKKFRVIVFDFLGWGSSDKPFDYPYSAARQLEELEKVIDYFDVNNIWIAAHDASGPPAINYSLNNPDKVEKLVLFNTYYSPMPTLKSPEAIWMFSTPIIRNFAGFFARNIKPLNKRIYYTQIGKFIMNESRKKTLIPKLFNVFSTKENFSAFLKLNADLISTIKKNTDREPESRKLSGKIIIIFGDKDPYLNTGVANDFEKLFTKSEKYIIQTAGHYVQVDAPETIANVLLNSRFLANPENNCT